MADVIKSAVLSACREFLRPVARMLLKKGIGYREFAELCKYAFVQVASDEYGIRGRKTNLSRVAVMTGLTRKEVRKIRDAIEAGANSQMARVGRPEAVLSLWYNAPEYLDDKGRPKIIGFDGPAPSFRDLVARAGGDIPPKAMLNELIRAGSIRQDDFGIHILSSSFVPQANDPQVILLSGRSIRHLVATIEHNWACEDPESRFVERRVFTHRLPSNLRGKFEKLARERGELLLNDLDRWIANREAMATMPGEGGEDLSEIGLGVYYFDDSVHDPKADES